MAKRKPKGKKKAIGDTNKPRLSLIPKEALWEMGKAFTYGAKKYNDDFNFHKGIELLFILDAAQRHILEFIDGEDFDKDSGALHLGNAMSNLAMAIYTYYNLPEMDNRWKKRKR